MKYVFILFCALSPLVASSQIQPAPLTIISPDFTHEGAIPGRFTCDGEGVNPTIIINGLPEGTKSLAVILENDDVNPKSSTQWIVWDIQPTETILENTVPGIVGRNSIGQAKYSAPCPDDVPKRYTFKVYALKSMLKLKSYTGRKRIEAAMTPYVIGSGKLTGIYHREIVMTGKEK
jgi:Raf kinase inhibitor-like YbhB/YbcL family protein